MNISCLQLHHLGTISKLLNRKWNNPNKKDMTHINVHSPNLQVILHCLVINQRQITCGTPTAYCKCSGARLNERIAS
jgi:hypothetical protein